MAKFFRMKKNCIFPDCIPDHSFLAQAVLISSYRLSCNCLIAAGPSQEIFLTPPPPHPNLHAIGLKEQLLEITDISAFR